MVHVQWTVRSKKAACDDARSPRSCGGGMPGVGPVATVAGLREPQPTRSSSAWAFAVPLLALFHVHSRVRGTGVSALGVSSTGGFFIFLLVMGSAWVSASLPSGIAPVQV